MSLKFENRFRRNLKDFNDFNITLVFKFKSTLYMFIGWKFESVFLAHIETSFLNYDFLALKI
jgi:hypothetical protein